MRFILEGARIGPLSKTTVDTTDLESDLCPAPLWSCVWDGSRMAETPLSDFGRSSRLEPDGAASRRNAQNSSYVAILNTASTLR
jgi:hypothetical protein